MQRAIAKVGCRIVFILSNDMLLLIANCLLLIAYCLLRIVNKGLFCTSYVIINIYTDTDGPALGR